MDRVMVYDGALPQTNDVLNTNKFGLVAQAFQNRALFGTSTVISGLAATPTSPTADLHVTIGVGSLYQSDPTDAAAYADLGVDNATIVKQALLQTPAVLNITPPGTVGFSQVYLVQAILNNVDAGATVLSYYNSANPAAPFAGPANSGSSNFTLRQCQCVIALKAGTPATTGTQTTPTPDAGYIGLYAITVANGQTQVTSGNIVQLPTAPFFPTLPAVPGSVQNGTWIYCLDTGTLNHLVITPSPNVTALIAGMGFRVKILVTNTGASDITINYTNSSGVASTLGPITVKRGSGAGVAANDLTTGTIVDLVYDGTFFQMANYLGSGTNTNTNTTVGIPYIADSGAVNALVATFSPSVGSYTAGLTIAVKLANTITGACTINANGLGLKNVMLGDLTNPPFNVFVAGMVLIMEYDGTQFQIINTSAGMFYRQPTSNYSIYVNTSTGSDTALDGTQASVSGSRGPYKTIQKALNVAWGYAPSLFTVTINVAAGTYNENPVSPSNPTTNVTINGAGVGSTILTPANAGAYAAQFQGPSNVALQNLTIQGTAIAGVISTNFMNLTVSNIALNGTYTIGQHLWTTNSGVLTVGTGVSFGGNCNACINSEQGGSIGFAPSAVVTISTPISVPTGFVFASLNGTISVNQPNPPTFVNPSFVSGPKYLASANGTVYALSQGVNFFPGSVAGSTSTGGQYIP